VKSFIQFIIPILILIVGGFFLMYIINPAERDKRLHIRCNDGLFTRSTYSVYNSKTISFMPNNEECNLEIKIENVSDGFIKINTPSMLHYDINGQVDESEPRRNIFLEIGEEVVVYSLDRLTRYTFQYK